MREMGINLSIKRLLSNVCYIIKFAIKVDKTAVFAVYGAYIAYFVIQAFYTSIFLKYFIDMLRNRSVNLPKTLLFVVFSMTVFIVGQGMNAVIENWAKVRFLPIIGAMEGEFIEKTASVDLNCYDHNSYFDDFVLAASQCEDMVEDGILRTAEIFGLTSGIFTLGALLLTIHPVVAIFPILGFVVNVLTRFRIEELEYNYRVEYRRIMRKADYSKRVFYQPEYAKEIKLSDIQVPLRKQFDEAIEEIEEKARKIGVKIAVLSLINWITVFTFLSAFCVPLYLGYLALVKRKISLGDVAAMNNAQEKIRNNLDVINYCVMILQQVGQFAERYRNFIDYDIKIENFQGSVEVPKEKGVLEIRNVSYRYDGSEKDTLNNINMVIHPGERVAIVGENGAGKTTFIKLLMRLYDVTAGEISYGGQDIRNYGTKEYRNIIGAVFQDYQLYGATLGENVVMGEYHEEKRELVEKALESADFTGKLVKLSNGIFTEMTKEFTNEGTMLSGGEAQKVSIARMFAKKDEMAIAILDEPSSALDPLAEDKLTRNMIHSAKEAAVIFISHRLSTTKDADHIYMFEKGEIVEHGTHEELMELNGSYAYMFEKQAHYYQEEIGLVAMA